MSTSSDENTQSHHTIAKRVYPKPEEKLLRSIKCESKGNDSINPRRQNRS